MPTVLVVDDTAVDRTLAGGLLENAPNVQVYFAENGQEALNQMGNQIPDIVVTDLQMPGMDGLELVTTIGTRYPEVPVVLMTAHGSEVVAAQALANGAASFVPKSELAENLVETVMHILVLAESDSRYRKLVQCATKTDFEFQLNNDPTIIDPLIEMIQQIATAHGLLSQNHRVQLGVALEHALLNGMIRGNLEISREEMPVIDSQIIRLKNDMDPYSGRQVYFRALINPESAKFTVRDEGPGMDLSEIPKATDPESFRHGIGRGLVLIQTFMDEVNFADSGNEIEMVKYRSQMIESTGL
ncbi:MAG: response regulator [Planctomycetota bacterium]